MCSGDHGESSGRGTEEYAGGRAQTVNRRDHDAGHRERDRERPKLHGARPQERKDNNMIVALTVAWFAVVGLVLIARGDYRQRQPLR